MTYLNYVTLCLLLLVSCSPASVHHHNAMTNEASNTTVQPVDYDRFLHLTKDIRPYREDRKLGIAAYAEMLQEEGVLLLDTRSARAYQAIHIEGAVHLNFSDFTVDKLTKVIPDKNTKILIYCNNNFDQAGIEMASKSPPLALNIPTFINLYGYGYENIYELDGSYTLEAAREYLNFEETPISRGTLQPQRINQE